MPVQPPSHESATHNVATGHSTGSAHLTGSSGFDGGRRSPEQRGRSPPLNHSSDYAVRATLGRQGRPRRPVSRKPAQPPILATACRPTEPKLPQQRAIGSCSRPQIPTNRLIAVTASPSPTRPGCLRASTAGWSATQGVGAGVGDQWQQTASAAATADRDSDRVRVQRQRRRPATASGCSGGDSEQRPA